MADVRTNPSARGNEELVSRNRIRTRNRKRRKRYENKSRNRSGKHRDQSGFHRKRRHRLEKGGPHGAGPGPDRRQSDQRGRKSLGLRSGRSGSPGCHGLWQRPDRERGVRDRRSKRQRPGRALAQRRKSQDHHQRRGPGRQSDSRVFRRKTARLQDERQMRRRHRPLLRSRGPHPGHPCGTVRRNRPDRRRPGHHQQHLRSNSPKAKSSP